MNHKQILPLVVQQTLRQTLFTIGCLLGLIGVQAETGFAQTIDVQQLLSENKGDFVEPAQQTGVGGTASSQTTPSQPALDPKRVNSINERIKLLKSLLRDEQDSKARPQADPPADIRQPKTPAPAPATEQQTQEPETKPVPKEPATQSSTAPKFQLVGAKISQPVNTLELGYSLFMTRNYDAAKRNFSELLVDETDSTEKAWLNCMIGCCLSREGKFTESDRSFRKCVNERGSNNFVTKYSEWKLRFLDGREKAIESLTSIETEINSLLADTKNGQ